MLVALVITVYLASAPSFAIGQEKQAAESPRLTSITADRLKISEEEVFDRAEELKRIQIDNFDKWLGFGDKYIAMLVKSFADHERRAAAVARGVAASGDADLEDTKSRMKQDSFQVQGIAKAQIQFGPRFLSARQVTANVVGALQGPTVSRPDKADGARAKADVDAQGIEEALERLAEWRRELEKESVEFEERLVPLKEQLGQPLRYFKALDTAESKSLAKLLFASVLRDVDLTEADFEQVLKDGSGLGQFVLEARLNESRSSQDWAVHPDDPSGQMGVIRLLRKEYDAAKAIKSETARDTVLEAIKQEIRKRSNELSAFERKIQGAKAMELEATVYVMLREVRLEIVKLLKASQPKATAPPVVDASKASLPELLAVAIPKIQELNQLTRRCREVWLR